MSLIEVVATAVAKEVVHEAAETVSDFISKNTRKSAYEDHLAGLDVSHVAVLGGEHD